MSEYLKQYVRYLKNTGQDPLPVEAFDEDWEPIGSRLREDLILVGWVKEVSGGLSLTPQGQAIK